MIHPHLSNPKSILVVGGSNNVQKPGGKILYNIIQGQYAGKIYVANPKEDFVQGKKSFRLLKDAPECDLTILAIPAVHCLPTIEFLVKERQAKAFIVISAGFGEVTEEGRLLEQKMALVVSQAGGTLIGPNCIGVINNHYHGVFTTPIPKLSKEGCDLISSSGSTAVFIMERAVSVGLQFSTIYTVGNAAQTSVEDVLAHMDGTFDPKTSSRTKMIYVEGIKDPQKFLHHCISLIQKGCQIAAIKAGVTDAGSRAASSHTGAMASSDRVIRALFRKAGIVYCSSREELIAVASILTYRKLQGENIAVITHAGGTAVLLTDALEKGGLSVPKIPSEIGEELATYLDPGSSVKNPIDFLATGTADQLGIIIDYVEHKMDFIDGMVVVFGSPGLFNVKNVYQVLNVKMSIGKKPIFPVLPSVINAHQELEYFTSTGHVNFPDEVMLGTALAQVYQTPLPQKESHFIFDIDIPKVQSIIDQEPDGYLSGKAVSAIFQAAKIPLIQETAVTNLEDAKKVVAKLGFPVVMKVIGVLHKTDVGGVIMAIHTDEQVAKYYDQLMSIPGATGVLIQPELKGIELFIGSQLHDKFGHIVLFGLGGILVEVFNDMQSVLAPSGKQEIKRLLKKLKGYKVLEGYRGKAGVSIPYFVELIQRVAALVSIAPQIMEMDINPIIASGKKMVVVDARIRIEGEAK